MEYKTLETGNSRKHNNQNNYQWNINGIYIRNKEQIKT